jgi:hypothetical protein
MPDPSFKRTTFGGLWTQTLEEIKGIGRNKVAGTVSV